MQSPMDATRRGRVRAMRKGVATKVFMMITYRARETDRGPIERKQRRYPQLPSANFTSQGRGCTSYSKGCALHKSNDVQSKRPLPSSGPYIPYLHEVHRYVWHGTSQHIYDSGRVIDDKLELRDDPTTNDGGKNSDHLGIDKSPCDGSLHLQRYRW